MNIPIICPKDKSLLIVDEMHNHTCPKCKTTYSEVNGVLKLLETKDEFYEGTYDTQINFLPKSEKFWHVWPLWLIGNGFLWQVRNAVKAGSKVIELGCASGVRYFGKHYSMIGCDVSFSALERLNGIYPILIQSDASLCIPVIDNSVDAVISSFFWEHIPPQIKPKILAECKRVLKPEGKLVFIYDIETQNPLIKHFKNKSAALYKKLFIDGDGHFGYQTPDENLNLFSAAGFKITKHLGLEKTFIQSENVYTKLMAFDQVSVKLFAWTKILSVKPLTYFYAFLRRAIDQLICPLLPKNWARIDVVICKKI